MTNYRIVSENPCIKVFNTGPEDENGELRTEVWFNYASVNCEREKFVDMARTIVNSSGGKFSPDLSDLQIGLITLQRNPVVKGTSYYDLDAAIEIVVTTITANAW